MKLSGKFIAVAFCIVSLASCGSGTDTQTSPDSLVATSTSSPESEGTDCDKECLAERLKQEELLKECEKSKSYKPQAVDTEDDEQWEPVVSTNSFDVDREGNVIVTGVLGDEVDFDLTKAHQTFGSSGWSFSFIAKFNKESEFVWIRCIKPETWFHWFIGPTVTTDAEGNIYFCDSSLTKFDSNGKTLWSKETQVTVSCETDSSGKTVLVGSGITLYDSNGIELWKIAPDVEEQVDYASAAKFDASGNIFAASRHHLTKYSSSGKGLWQVTFEQRYEGNFGPEGLSEYGPTYVVTDDVGLNIDSKGDVYLALSINKKNDFSQSSASKIINPSWLQDVAIAKYSNDGALVWVNKVEIPNTVRTTTRYAEGYDISFTPQHEIIVLGGGWKESISNGSKLFLAKFSPAGKQVRFMWLDEYTAFIHNLGHKVFTNSRGRTYVTAEGELMPPFLLSRDL